MHAAGLSNSSKGSPLYLRTISCVRPLTFREYLLMGVRRPMWSHQKAATIGGICKASRAVGPSPQSANPAEAPVNDSR